MDYLVLGPVVSFVDECAFVKFEVSEHWFCRITFLDNRADFYILFHLFNVVKSFLRFENMVSLFCFRKSVLRKCIFGTIAPRLNRNSAY